MMTMHRFSILGYADNPKHCKNETARPSGKTSRKQRRHTVSGESTIKLSDIETWIAASHSSAAVSDDENAVVALPRMIRSKLARTRSNDHCSPDREMTTMPFREGGRNERAEASQREEGGRERPAKKGKRENGESSCFYISADAHRWNDGTWARRRERELVTKARAVEDAKLSGRTKRKTSCFLTPRPYRRETPKPYSSVALTTAWNGTDETAVERSRSTQMTSELHSVTSFSDMKSKESRPESSLPISREDPRYDTFLDLSNLHLDDDAVEDVIAQPETSGGQLDDDHKGSEHIVTNGHGRAVKSPPGHELASETFHKCSDMPSYDANNDAELRQATTQDPQSLDRNESEAEFEKGTTTSLEVAEAKEDDPSDFVGIDLRLEEDVKDCVDYILSEIPKEECHLRVEKRLEDDKQSDDDSMMNRPSCSHDNDAVSSVLERLVSASIDKKTENREEGAKSSSGTSTEGFSSEEESNSENDYAIEQEEEEDPEIFHMDLHSQIEKTMSLDRSAFKPFAQMVSTSKQPTTQRDPDKELSNSQAHLNMGLKRLFQIALSAVSAGKKSFVKLRDVLDLIEAKGIRTSDPRMRESFRRVEEEPDGADTSLTYEVFVRFCEPSFKFIRSVLLSQLSVPGFSILKLRMERIFETLRDVLEEKAESPPKEIDACSNYNVMMRRHKQSDSYNLSFSICTVDGQRLSFGDKEIPHPLNACASVFNVCLACKQNGKRALSFYFKENHDNREHPHYDSTREKSRESLSREGSFIATCLLYRQVSGEKRLEALHDFYSTLIGNEPLCCDNLSYNFRRNYAHEEIAIAHHLSAHQSLPKGASSELPDLIEFHLQSLSTAMTSDACSVGAATLANNGTCPLTGEAVLDNESVKTVLKSMATSAQTSYCVSTQDVVGCWDENGSIILVVPGVLGIVCFAHCQSPATVDALAKSLITELDDNFNFSVYKSLKKTGSISES